jgi:hypothetical protein
MPAPYLVQTRNGLFQIVRASGADVPAPPAQEVELAQKINSCLDWVIDNPQESAGLQPQYAEVLRGIADEGLTRSENRDVRSARQKFDELYGSDSQERPRPPAPGAFTVRLGSDNEIIVTEVAGDQKATDDQFKFASELDRQDRLVRALYQHGEPDPRLRAIALAKSTKRLLWAAKIGLEGKQPNVTLARLAIQAVILDGIQEHGVTIRVNYLVALAKAYGVGAFAIAVASIVVILIGHGSTGLNAIMPPELIVPGLTMIQLTITMWSLCFGAWLSAAVRLEPDSPEVLDSIFRATFNANIRAIYILGFGFLAVLLLHKQVIVFSFGGGAPGSNSGFTTALVLHQLSAAILAGAFLGIGERTLPNAVVQRSANLIAALSPK